MPAALANVADILQAANLQDEPSLTIIHAANPQPPITTGPLLILLSEDGRPPAALRRYPPQHGVRIVKEDGTLQAATAGACEENLSGAAALAVDPIPLFDVRQAPDGVRGVIDCLRDPVDGCPWDNAQTHESLRPHLLEETYEVLEAIAGGSAAELCEELGDVLMQVVLHAKLAEQAGQFTLDDVAEGIRAKLVRRHPHVFADAAAGEDARWVEGVWEQLKAKERPHRESVLDGVPKTLPALARAQSIIGRAERNGFPRALSTDAALGEQLLNLVQQARAADVSAEDSLRDALGKFEQGVRAAEAGREQGG